jgi:hypothetical protein
MLGCNLCKERVEADWSYSRDIIDGIRRKNEWRHSRHGNNNISQKSGDLCFDDGRPDWYPSLTQMLRFKVQLFRLKCSFKPQLMIDLMNGGDWGTSLGLNHWSMAVHKGRPFYHEHCLLSDFY